MAIPQTREQLIDWAFRKLGRPVINVEIADEQAEDRVDEALILFRQFHKDGTEREYLKHQITEQDINNQYLIVPDNVSSISRIFALRNMGSMSGLFNFQYQFFMNDFYAGGKYLPSGTLTNYNVTMNYLAEYDFFFNGQRSIDFKKSKNRLDIHTDWTRFKEDQFIVFDARVITDMNENSKLWGDPWIMEYTYTLMELQWVNNLRKIKNVAGIGGATIDVDGIERVAEIRKEKLETQLTTKYGDHAYFFVG